MHSRGKPLSSSFENNRSSIHSLESDNDDRNIRSDHSEDTNAKLISRSNSMLLNTGAAPKLPNDVDDKQSEASINTLFDSFDSSLGCFPSDLEISNENISTELVSPENQQIHFPQRTNTKANRSFRSHDKNYDVSREKRNGKAVASQLGEEERSFENERSGFSSSDIVSQYRNEKKPVLTYQCNVIHGSEFLDNVSLANVSSEATDLPINHNDKLAQLGANHMSSTFASHPAEDERIEGEHNCSKAILNIISESQAEITETPPKIEAVSLECGVNRDHEPIQTNSDANNSSILDDSILDEGEVSLQNIHSDMDLLPTTEPQPNTPVTLSSTLLPSNANNTETGPILSSSIAISSDITTPPVHPLPPCTLSAQLLLLLQSLYISTDFGSLPKEDAHAGSAASTPSFSLTDISTHIHKNSLIVPRLRPSPFLPRKHPFFAPSLPHGRAAILLVGNHSSGKSSFVNWFIGSQVQAESAAMETSSVTVVTSRGIQNGQKEGGNREQCYRSTLRGTGALRELSFLRGIEAVPGLVESLTCEIVPFISPNPASASSLWCSHPAFLSTDLIDTPGLADGGVGYDFEIETALTALAARSNVVLVFLDPHGQATIRRTQKVIRALKSVVARDRIHFILGKTDTISSETERLKVVSQISQRLASLKPSSINSHDDDIVDDDLTEEEERDEDDEIDHGQKKRQKNHRLRRKANQRTSPTRHSHSQKKMNTVVEPSFFQNCLRLVCNILTLISGILICILSCGRWDRRVVATDMSSSRLLQTKQMENFDPVVYHSTRDFDDDWVENIVETYKKEHLSSFWSLFRDSPDRVESSSFADELSTSLVSSKFAKKHTSERAYEVLPIFLPNKTLEKNSGYASRLFRPPTESPMHYHRHYYHQSTQHHQIHPTNLSPVDANTQLQLQIHHLQQLQLQLSDTIASSSSPTTGIEMLPISTVISSRDTSPISIHNTPSRHVHSTGRLDPIYPHNTSSLGGLQHSINPSLYTYGYAMESPLSMLGSRQHPLYSSLPASSFSHPSTPSANLYQFSPQSPTIYENHIASDVFHSSPSTLPLYNSRIGDFNRLEEVLKIIEQASIDLAQTYVEVFDATTLGLLRRLKYEYSLHRKGVQHNANIARQSSVCDQLFILLLIPAAFFCVCFLHVYAFLLLDHVKAVWPALEASTWVLSLESYFSVILYILRTNLVVSISTFSIEILLGYLATVLGGYLVIQSYLTRSLTGVFNCRDEDVILQRITYLAEMRTKEGFTDKLWEFVVAMMRSGR